MSGQDSARVTAILVPCYNEAATIGKVVADFLAIDPSVIVYVYDNNSTDDSARLAEEAGATVVRSYKQGKGYVVRQMFRDIDADAYVMVDGDDTYPADEALAMRDLIFTGAADMVIGDRLSTTYARENKRRLHGFGNRMVRFLVNSLFDAELHDIMTGCRCLSRRFVKTMPVMSPGFEIETEMTVHALDKRFLVVEVPVDYRDRGEGSESKLNTYSDGARVIRTLVMLLRDYRPMRFFGAISAVLTVAATAMFAVPLAEYFRTGLVSKFPTLIVSVALGIAAMLSFVCGAVLDTICAQSRRQYELDVAICEEQAKIRRAQCLP